MNLVAESFLGGFRHCVELLRQRGYETLADELGDMAEGVTDAIAIHEKLKEREWIRQQGERFDGSALGRALSLMQLDADKLGHSLTDDAKELRR